MARVAFGGKWGQCGLGLAGDGRARSVPSRSSSDGGGRAGQPVPDPGEEVATVHGGTLAGLGSQST